jgi:uncharacterized delta-60 repeat protein
MTVRLVFWAAVISALLSAQLAHASPGELDTTFAGDGVVDTDSPGGTYEPRVAVYPDARTVLAASTRATASNRAVFSVWRFTSTGTPDLTFGSTGNGRVLVDFSGYDAFLTGVAIQPDGKVVLAGMACAPRDPQSTDLPTNCSVAVARLLPTGRYDPAFAFGGRVLVPTGDSSAAVALIIHPLDGGILIAGSSIEPISQRWAFALLRLTPSGWPDASFGHDGKVWVTVNAGGNSLHAYATSVAVQSTGNIVLAGWAAGVPVGQNMALARVNRNGTLDTSFASGGTTVVLFTRGGNIGVSRVHAVALQANDDIIVGGYGWISAPGPLYYLGPLIRRLTKDGILDVSFSGGETGMILEFQDSTDNTIHGLAVQSDDKIVVTGWHYRDPAPQDPVPQYIAYRLQPAGGLDSTFGTGGISVVNGGISSAVTVQRYGCIVLAGLKDHPVAPPAQRQAAAIRLVGDPVPRHPYPPCRRLVEVPIPDTLPPIVVP